MPGSPTDLPDVNIWVALSDDQHLHHPAASAYWSSQRGDLSAFCGVTLLGMLRILTLPSAMNGNPFTPSEAIARFREFSSLPDVTFLEDSPLIAPRVEAWSRQPIFTKKLWTDAWIAALALEHGCRVVSFDTDFAKFPGLDFLLLRP